MLILYCAVACPHINWSRMDDYFNVAKATAAPFVGAHAHTHANTISNMRTLASFLHMRN